MSEIEQLVQQKEQIQIQQEKYNKWQSIKKNLSTKFKNSTEAYKQLIKENAKTLTQDDFLPYAKEEELNDLFKDQSLDEENFIKIWEQWEFQFKANQHKLQMIDEKLELLGILEEKEIPLFKDDPSKKKQLISQIQKCENLDELHQKLGEMLKGQQQQQQQQQQLNENEIFSQYVNKKSQIKFNELSISKIQVKQSEDQQQQQQQQPLIESQIISSGKVTLPKKSYLEIQNNYLNRKGNNSQQSKTFIANNNNLKIISPKDIKKDNKFNSPNSFNGINKYEENDQLRRSQKSRKLKGDLQNYIGDLFQNDNQKTQGYLANTRGLAGFSGTKKYNKVQQKIDFPPGESLESLNIQKRVQSIRNKLSEYASKKVRRTSPQKQSVFPINNNISRNYTPERISPRRSSPYTPGNIHRLNVDRLQKEKERDEQNFSGKKQDNQEQEDDNPKILERQKLQIME